MRPSFVKILIIVCAVFAAGCASKKNEDIIETNQKILRENETRLNQIEKSITSLNSQVSQLNNRVYEVRTRTGQKTSMTVVPVAAGQTANAQAAVAPVKYSSPVFSQSAVSSAPIKSRKIESSVASPALPSKAGKMEEKTKAANASGSIGQQVQTQGAAGRLAGLKPEEELGLPPSENIAVPRAQSSVTAPVTSSYAQQADQGKVPVPSMGNSDLSLPPEQAAIAVSAQTADARQNVSQPVLAQTAQTLPAVSQAAQQQRVMPAAKRAGEESAYNAALNAARSGRVAEAIPMFENFVKEYPGSKYQANANYWIGECLYAQGKLQDALNQFQNVNAAFPKHHKNADALLKAGMTLSRMGDKAAAEEKYRTVLASFPNSEAARRIRAMGIRH